MLLGPKTYGESLGGIILFLGLPFTRPTIEDTPCVGLGITIGGGRGMGLRITKGTAWGFGLRITYGSSWGVGLKGTKWVVVLLELESHMEKARVWSWRVQTGVVVVLDLEPHMEKFGV